MNADKILAEPLTAEEEQILRVLGPLDPRRLAEIEKELAGRGRESRERLLTFCAAFLKLPPDRQMPMLNLLKSLDERCEAGRAQDHRPRRARRGRAE